jgi:methionine-S-sulfoxide reductase
MSLEILRDIYYAGGCFWGVEKYFSRFTGVHDTTVGYANGNTQNPTYEEVCRKNTGHAETVHVRYSPDQISLKALTEHFFKVIDPTSLNKQGGDVGTQYRTGIYYVNEDDVDAIKEVMSEIQKEYREPVVTELEPLRNFYPAEEYHQDYLVKNPNGYCHINFEKLDKKIV